MEAAVKERAVSLEEMLNRVPTNPDAELDAHYEAVIKPFLKKVLDYCRKFKEEKGYMPVGGGCCDSCILQRWPNPEYGSTAAGVILDMLGMAKLC